MRDILPPEVLDRIRDRYITGVSDAVANFGQSSADEDALTGALGQAIATTIPLKVPTPAGIVAVKVSYRKIRGRGHGAPEKRYGSDGIFQLEVIDDSGRVLRRKGLPFQAKKDWHGTNSELAKQAARMLALTGSSIVVDYKHTGYSACKASLVVACRGKRGEAHASGRVYGLGQILGNEFLECNIGTVGLYYDAEEYRRDASHLHVITTTVSGPFVGVNF